MEPFRILGCTAENPVLGTTMAWACHEKCGQCRDQRLFSRATLETSARSQWPVQMACCKAANTPSCSIMFCVDIWEVMKITLSICCSKLVWFLRMHKGLTWTGSKLWPPGTDGRMSQRTSRVYPLVCPSRQDALPHVLLLTFSYWNMEDVDLDGRSNRKNVAHLGIMPFLRMEYKALSNGM